LATIKEIYGKIGGLIAEESEREKERMDDSTESNGTGNKN